MTTNNLLRLTALKPQSYRIVRFIDRTIGCDWAKVRPIGNVCYDLSSSRRMPRSISTRGRAITNDWIISMATAIAGNRATSGSDQRLMYDQSWRPTKIDRTINRSIVRPIVRPIVATYDRSYDHSWYQTVWNRRLQVLNMTIDLVATDLPLAITHNLCDQSYVLSTIYLRYQICWSQLRRNLVVSPVWLGLNMTYDLAATDFALAITHDLCDQSYILSTICPRFRHFSVAGR